MASCIDPEKTNILRFQRKVEAKYGVKFENYWEFHKWSIKHYEEIWAELFEFFDIIHSKPYTKVIDTHEKLEDLPEWFPGARLNYTENMLRHNEEIALILLGEEKTSAEKVTYRQLRDEVSVVSSALRKAGIKIGDIIACYMSTRKETLVAKLAAASIGAIFTAVNPLMGVQAIVSRFQQVSPKVLFTVDRHLYNKEEKDILKRLPEIVSSLPTLELVVIVPSNQQSLNKDISHISNSIFYPKFIENGLEENGKIPEPHYEQLPFSHPFIMNFTSGTTGSPKGMIHSTGAALLVSLSGTAFSYDVHSNDVLFLIHLPGWASLNIFISVLALGATTVLYEGLPYYNREPSYWDIVDTYGVTCVFLTPTVLEDMDNKNIVPGPNNTLKTLRFLLSGSSPVKSFVYDFVENRIKKGLFFTTLYGSTEFLSMTFMSNPNLPIYKEEMQIPILGLDIFCCNESGKRVVDEVGEVVVASPCPSHPIGIWKNGKIEKYSGEALTKFPGLWWIGDMGMINSKTGGLLVPGRCDDTIKNKGARFGSSEIYGVVNKLEDVDDSICVSRILKTGHEVAVLFIKMMPGKEFSPKFVDFVRLKIKDELSFRHVPEMIFPVKDIPLNLNGKRMETLVKKILARAENLPLEAILNPECLDEYFEYAKSTL